jgi:hypothetical protein
MFSNDGALYGDYICHDEEITFEGDYPVAQLRASDTDREECNSQNLRAIQLE